MKKYVFILLAAFSLLFFSCAAKTDANGWYSDFESCQKDAKRKNKNILLFVNSMNDDQTNLDGVKLLTETNEFTKAVEEDFLCLHFDFTRIPEVMGKSTEGLTGSEQKAVEAEKAFMMKQFTYADLYGVKDTPAAIVISKEGYYICKINFDYLDTSVSGYKSCLYLEIGTVEDFYANLKKARKSPSVEERIAAYDEFYGSTEESLQPVMIDLWREAMNADKTNATGKIVKYIMTCAYVDAFEKINEKKYLEAVEIFKTYSADERLSNEDKQVLLFYAANVYISSGSVDYDEIISLLTQSLELAPESEHAEGIRTYISQAEEYKNSAKPVTPDEK